MNRSERQREWNRNYRTLHPERDLSSKNRWKKNNREKNLAHKAVNYAVASGVLERPEACAQCGIKSEIIQGHHEDYSKRLSVDWLCPQCHGLRHPRGAQQ